MRRAGAIVVVAEHDVTTVLGFFESKVYTLPLVKITLLIEYLQLFLRPVWFK